MGHCRVSRTSHASSHAAYSVGGATAQRFPTTHHAHVLALPRPSETCAPAHAAQASKAAHAASAEHELVELTLSDALQTARDGGVHPEPSLHQTHPPAVHVEQSLRSLQSAAAAAVPIVAACASVRASDVSATAVSNAGNSSQGRPMRKRVCVLARFLAR